MNQRAHRADELQDSFVQATEVTRGPSLVTWGLTFPFLPLSRMGKKDPFYFRESERVGVRALGWQLFSSAFLSPLTSMNLPLLLDNLKTPNLYHRQSGHRLPAQSDP